MTESKYYGIYQGVVTNITDPEKRGRIKVKCPNVLGSETESAWCDPLVPVAYDNGGDFCIPTKNETVWLQFIAGDVNRPVYMGGWWSKDKTPLGVNYSNIDQVRIISYADCTITMQNGKIDINTKSGAFDLRIEDGKLTIEGDLTVSGNISAKNVTAQQVVTAQSITATGNAGIVTAPTVNVANSISASTIQVVNGITAKSISVDTVDADSVSANSVTADGVSLSSHTHSGVESGLSNTGTPN